MFTRRIKAALLASTVAIATLGLAGCDDAQTAATIAQIQNATTLACSFVPTAASVASILSALYPPSQIPVGVATSVAHQICSAVTAKSAARGAQAPTFAGVVIEGHFLNGGRRR